MALNILTSSKMGLQSNKCIHHRANHSYYWVALKESLGRVGSSPVIGDPYALFYLGFQPKKRVGAYFVFTFIM